MGTKKWEEVEAAARAADPDYDRFLDEARAEAAREEAQYQRDLADRGDGGDELPAGGP